MGVVIIEKQEDKPYVLMDDSDGRFILRGRSYPEDPYEFYSPFIQWVKQLPNKDISKLFVEIDVDYFNTSSFKMVFNLLFEIEQIHDSYGLDVTILWLYDFDSLDIKEAGEEIADIIKLPFDIKQLVEK